MRARIGGLTPRQTACLHAIRNLSAVRGVMPSLSELQRALGVRSRSSVRKLLLQLESRGAIERVSRRARAIRLVEIRCPYCDGAFS
jgi:SOS-response transcriptional repressor LexA